MYHFIQSLAAEHAVETMCRLLAVSRSAYYQWLQAGKERDAGEKKKTLANRIVSIFQEHRRRYGVRFLNSHFAYTDNIRDKTIKLKYIYYSHWL